MDMKNTKAVFLIILGSFLLATGFAYAEDKPAMQSLKEWAGDTTPVQVLNAAGVGAATTKNAGTTKGIDLAVKASTGPVVPAVTAPAPATPEPTFAEKFKKFWDKENGSSMVISGAVIGLLGFLAMGPVGLLLGVAAFGFFYFINNY